MVLRPLKVTKITFPATYELVDWPDDCPNTPTYFQLMSTLELLDMYKSFPADKFGKGNSKAIEKWLAKNSIKKFEQAANLAEEVQDRLDYLEQDCIETNREFPMKHRRRDN